MAALKRFEPPAPPAMFDVDVVKKDFPILDRQIHGKRLVFLDSAASSQKPRSVIDAMSGYYENTHANVHRGVYTLAEEATNAYEGARRRVASFINAESHEQVLFSKNVTESLNLVAQTWARQNLQKGDAIVLTEMEHHANLVPWMMIAEEKEAELRYLQVDERGLLDLSAINQALDGAKLLAVTGVSNVLGTINPVDTLVTAAHNHGAVVVFDFAQWVPHLPTDVQALGADFVAFTGHKMLGPTGVGVLYGKRELLEAMPPFLGGGDMILDVSLDGFVPNQLPWKFEAGTPPIAEVIGLGAAVDYLDRLGMDNIRAHEKALTAYALAQIQEYLAGRIQVFGPLDADLRSGVVGFEMGEVHPHDISQVLDEDGICIRAGHHCAKPLHKKYGVGASARASFYVYNDESDVDALVAGLVRAADFFGR